MKGHFGQGHLFDEDRIWMANTNFPYGIRKEIAPGFNAQKMICLVRNPLEVISTLAYIVHMQSETLDSVEKFENFPSFWAKWVIRISTYI